LSNLNKVEKGRILALDIGEVRTGLALSDLLRKHASAFQVLDTKQLCLNNKGLREVINEYEVTLILVGLPLDSEGNEGPQTRRVRNLAQHMLEGFVDIPVIFFDERMSSKEAMVQAHDRGLNTRDMRGKLDAFAAAVFLQSYLDTIDN